MDFENFISLEPVFLQLNFLNILYPITNSADSTVVFNSFISLNQYKTYDNYWLPNFVTKRGQFYRISSTQESIWPLSDVNENNLFLWQINLDDVQKYYERNAYNILNYLGDVGGVNSIIIVVLSYLVKPFTSLTFNLYILKKYRNLFKNISP